jgi:hypothetical protein
MEHNALITGSKGKESKKPAYSKQWCSKEVIYPPFDQCSACYLLRAIFLFDLLSDPEDGGMCSSKTSADFHHTAWYYTPEV